MGEESLLSLAEHPSDGMLWCVATERFLLGIALDPVAHGFETWCVFMGRGGEKNVPKDEKSRIFPT